jgi:hypothetical protein
MKKLIFLPNGLITLSIFIITCTTCTAQTTPHRSLLALSKTDHLLSIVDPVTLKTVARIRVGEDPHEVCASMAAVVCTK